jgi:hypothetical protein
MLIFNEHLFYKIESDCMNLQQFTFPDEPDVILHVGFRNFSIFYDGEYHPFYINLNEEYNTLFELE